jgi:hypothetical protein
MTQRGKQGGLDSISLGVLDIISSSNTFSYKIIDDISSGITALFSQIWLVTKTEQGHDQR